MPMPLPLSGIRVVSLAHQYPGPFATMLLSDLGADVVLVERPPAGDPARAFPGFHAALARGKRSVALDLKAERGRQLLLALVDRADAVLDGYRPGTLARLGLGHECLTARRPELIYVAVTGYGQTGPYAHRSGHDLTYQAEAGMLYEHVPPADPAAPPALALGDLAAGLLAVQAVLLGLVRRGRTGAGSVLDVSMFDGLVSLLATHLGPVVNGTGAPGFPYEPGYGVFHTGGGPYLALGVAHEDHFWRALCDVTGLGDVRELTAPQRFAAADSLRARLATALRGRTSEEWARILTAADVPFGLVRSLTELPDSPQAIARNLFTTIAGPGGGPEDGGPEDCGDGGDRVTHVRQPLRIDGHTPGPRGGVPRLGEHTRQVLAEWGIDRTEIDAALRDGAAVQDSARSGAGGKGQTT